MTSVAGQTTLAFAAGVLTFFSPCVFALLPGYVGYYVGAVEGESAALAGALSRGIAASVGALGTFALLSVPAVAATATFERVLPTIEPLVGVLLIALGVALVWKRSLSVTVPLPERRTSVLGFAGFGAMYALAATACVLPVFLAIVVGSVGLSPAGTALVLVAYAGAFALLMLAATIAVAVGQGALLGRLGSHVPALTRAAGVVLVLAGLVQLYIAFWVAPIESLG